MAKNSITDYSKTASLNTDIQSVDIDEGCLPSGINNAIRELMADLADMNDGTVTLTSPSFAAATITGDLTVDTNTLKVDSTNNRVGIGTASPDAKLTLKNPSVSNDQNIITVQSAASTDSLAKLVYNQTDDSLKIINASTFSGSHMDFWTNNTERMRIDSSGRVGIGTTSPSYDLHIEKSNASGNVDFLIKNSGTTSSSNTRILSYVSGASGGDPSIGVGITGVQDYFWRIDNDDSDKLKLDSNGTTRMTITSSGLVGIGESSPATALDVNGTINVRTSGYQFGRITTNNVDTNNGGLTFQTISGGSFSERMRIQSGGGISFNGDTAAANALDDYEEGTWTPTLGGSSSNPTVSYSSSLRSGTYVKIGKLVYCTFIMDIASCSGGSGTALISGLPYTAENNNASYGNQPLLIDRLAGDYRQVSSQTEPNQSYAVMIRNAGSTGSHSGVDVSTLANMSCRGTIIYRAS